MQALTPGLAVEVIEHQTRDEFRAWWFTQREVSFTRIWRIARLCAHGAASYPASRPRRNWV
jgi:hypothetical protein